MDAGAAFIATIVLGFSALKLYRSGLRLQKHFSFDETQSVNFDDFFELGSGEDVAA